MRVGLIACCKEKLDHPAPAQELYRSALFRLSKEWISRGRVDAWAILSAKHGLVMPDQIIEPYDHCLTDVPKALRLEWQALVHDQLMEKWGEDAIYLILAGWEYRQALKRMPMVEDAIDHWTMQRRDDGMSSRKAAMGIGVLMRYLKEDRSFY